VGAQHTASSGGGNDHDDSRHRNQSGGNSLRGKHNRSQASNFRKQCDYRRTVRLIDVDSNKTITRMRGRMNTTSHERVLASLLHRADRFCNICQNNQDKSHAWALDKTGTMRTSTIKFSEVEQQEKEEVNNIDVPNEVLQVHGLAPQRKVEGILQLIYKNMNGLSNRMCNNKKLEKARAIELEVDIAAYHKHQLNMRHHLNCNGLNQVFIGGEAAIQSIVAHNVHKNVGRTQQGGTSVIMFGPITEQIDHERSVKVNTGLGRWTVMTLQ
jgi:hypothetical protein